MSERQKHADKEMLLLIQWICSLKSTAKASVNGHVIINYDRLYLEIRDSEDTSVTNTAHRELGCSSILSPQGHEGLEADRFSSAAFKVLRPWIFYTLIIDLILH